MRNKCVLLEKLLDDIDLYLQTPRDYKSSSTSQLLVAYLWGDTQRN